MHPGRQSHLLLFWLQAAGSAPSVQRLLPIPGTGKAYAFSIRLELGDIARFETDRKLCSYCRLVPGADNSRDRVRHKRSRDGNRYLKLASSHARVHTGWSPG